MSLDQIKVRANNPFETARLGIAQVNEDRDRLIKAVEAVEKLVGQTVNTRLEYAAGYLAQDIRAALTAALGGE